MKSSNNLHVGWIVLGALGLVLGCGGSGSGSAGRDGASDLAASDARGASSADGRGLDAVGSLDGAALPEAGGADVALKMDGSGDAPVADPAGTVDAPVGVPDATAGDPIEAGGAAGASGAGDAADVAAAAGSADTAGAGGGAGSTGAGGAADAGGVAGTAGGTGTPGSAGSTGTGGATGAAGATGTPHCAGTPSALCSTENASAQACTAIPGCNATVTPASCSGTAKACTANADATTCGAQPGCLWPPGTGICFDACGTYKNDQSACKGSSCTWTPTSAPVCTGSSPGNCSEQGLLYCELVPGCTWTQNFCYGIHSACNTRPKATCANDPACTWVTRGAIEVCAGIVPACDTIKNEGVCGASGGCHWMTTGTCVGTSSPCETRNNQESCISGCFWGSLEGTCTSPVNCGANTTSGTCPSPQCGWSTSLACGGTPTSCASILTGPACQAAGCTLTAAGLVCGGTPTPCDQLSVANCTKQPGCQVAN